MLPVNWGSWQGATSSTRLALALSLDCGPPRRSLLPLSSPFLFSLFPLLHPGIQRATSTTASQPAHKHSSRPFAAHAPGMVFNKLRKGERRSIGASIQVRLSDAAREELYPRANGRIVLHLQAICGHLLATEGATRSTGMPSREEDRPFWEEGEELPHFQARPRSSREDRHRRSIQPW